MFSDSAAIATKKAIETTPIATVDTVGVWYFLCILANDGGSAW